MTATNPAHRARLSLAGLALGDAFGETFFVNPAVVERLIAERALARAPWRWTDDTAMAPTP
jgi:ADP-ribosylglycohydrolase